ncbi:MAG: CCA tRNA nucleotidyltransferase [Oceanipulchritudo sp.]
MEEIIGHFRPEHWQFLKELAGRCSRQGGRAYLVGGCVRSALLGEAVLDFDVEVFHLTPRRLETILSALAPVSRVGRAFGIYKLGGWPVDVGLPRSERKSGRGHRSFEIDIRPDMPIGEAAKRRDFTVNAIYFDILGERIVDPLGGRADLEEKCLRHCSSRFVEDSLRVLRGMQLAARIPARVDPETRALCATLDPENLSPERYFAEWEKLLLSGKKPSVGLDFLRACGWVRFFPELEAMVDCPQDPQWHPEGDVWTHTLHCMDAFAETRSGNREEDLIVGFAVLCHDMGKPLTMETGNGRIRTPAHEHAGVGPASAFLEKLNVPGRLREQILPLVKCHMRPAILHADRSSPAAIRRLARDCGRMDLLLRVFTADAAGRPPLPSNSSEAAAWLREQSRLLDVENSRPEPLIRGRDLLQRGWKSGPEMGEFLSRAYEAQLDGVFSDPAGAAAWLDHHGRGKPGSDETQPEETES